MAKLILLSGMLILHSKKGEFSMQSKANDEFK